MAEKKTEGTEPWVMDPWRMDPWTRAMASTFRFWLSFWPIAPLFGVEWRFAEPSAGTQTKTQATTQTQTQTQTKTQTKTGTKTGAKAGARAAPETAPAPPAAPAGRKDDLTRIKGIGPGVARQLEALGIRSFAQLAALSPEELAELDAKLTSIKGSCYRNDWVGQAKALAG